MAILQIISIDEDAETALVLWDNCLVLNHHKSDSEDYVEKLKREYPEEEVVRQQRLVELDLAPSFNIVDEPTVTDPIEFDYADYRPTANMGFVNEVSL